jgi:hypothetical protein
MVMAHLVPVSPDDIHRPPAASDSESTHADRGSRPGCRIAGKAQLIIVAVREIV